MHIIVENFWAQSTSSNSQQIHASCRYETLTVIHRSDHIICYHWITSRSADIAEVIAQSKQRW